MSALPRIAKVVLPLLKDGLEPEHPELGRRVYTWNPDVDNRVFPWVQVRRLGGIRHSTRPLQLGMPIIELTCHGNIDLPTTEQLYEDALEVLYLAVDNQTQTPDGYLHSIKETLGMTQFSSLFQDSWRVQGLIRLGVRPPRTTT